MPSARPVLWAYTYRLDPPLPASRLKGIKKLLEREHLMSKAREGTWEGRMVADVRVANILVVSDTPDVGGAANHRLEAALHALQASFELTVPMVVAATPSVDLPPTD